MSVTDDEYDKLRIEDEKKNLNNRKTKENDG
jgi:hypothetical protein